MVSNVISGSGYELVMTKVDKLSVAVVSNVTRTPCLLSSIDQGGQAADSLGCLT